MRISIVAAVALVAGCAPDYFTPEAISARAEVAQQARERAVTEQHAYINSPAGQADLGCRTKTQFAMAGWRSRSFLDLEGTARANQMHASCMDYWRRTGQMP